MLLAANGDAEMKMIVGRLVKLTPGSDHRRRNFTNDFLIVVITTTYKDF